MVNTHAEYKIQNKAEIAKKIIDTGHRIVDQVLFHCYASIRRKINKVMISFMRRGSVEVPKVAEYVKSIRKASLKR